MSPAIIIWLLATIGWGFSAYTGYTVFPHRACVLMTWFCGSFTFGLVLGLVVK